MPKINIVLDKSYLQGTDTGKIRGLSKTHRFLMSDVLMHELLTTSNDVRTQSFRKFMEEENPVDLIEHIGIFIRQEIEFHKPSGKPSAQIVEGRFQFNPELATGGYKSPKETNRAIMEHEEYLKTSVEGFMEAVEIVPDLFPDLLSGSDANRNQYFFDAVSLIVSPDKLLPCYEILDPPEKTKPLPPVDIVNNQWAIYIWLQVRMLFALHIYVHHNGTVPNITNKNIYTKMEHDVLDAQLLMLACLEGDGFATKERKLIKWWELLRPDGNLLS